MVQTTRKQLFDDAKALSNTPFDYIKMAFIADVNEDSHEAPTYPQGETQLFLLTIGKDMVYMTFNNWSTVARIWTSPSKPMRVVMPFAQLWKELGQI